MTKNITKNILLPQVTEVDTIEHGIVKQLKSCTITIPTNVLDVAYFVNCVQYHVFDLASANTSTDLQKVKQDMEDLKKAHKDTGTKWYNLEKKLNDALNLLALLAAEIKVLDKHLEEEYEDIEDVKKVFLRDRFAKVFAWTLTGYKSKKVWKNEDETKKGKIEEIQFRFKDENKIVSLLQVFDFSHTQDQKKASAHQIELYANSLFATNGGDVYKNICYKFSPEKVNRDLYTRFKKPYSHDGKGNIKDVQNLPFDLCKQLYFMCLLQLGVPSIDGQKLIKVDEVQAENAPILVKKKKKQDEK